MKIQDALGPEERAVPPIAGLVNRVPIVSEIATVKMRRHVAKTDHDVISGRVIGQRCFILVNRSYQNVVGFDFPNHGLLILGRRCRNNNNSSWELAEVTPFNSTMPVPVVKWRMQARWPR